MALFPEQAIGLTHGRSEGKAHRVWGGFFRRYGAFLIDLVVLFLFSVLLFYLLFVGYRVGLAARQEVLSPDRMGVFSRIFFFAWLFLVGSYFVVLHRVGGQTVGKWIMGLRVVEAQGNPITYRQAVIRLMGYLASSLFGLGFLWILWSREKRGWHDLLAGTWVIRE